MSHVDLDKAEITVEAFVEGYVDEGNVACLKAFVYCTRGAVVNAFYNSKLKKHDDLVLVDVSAGLGKIERKSLDKLILKGID